MRRFLIFAFLVAGIVSTAQTPLSFGFMDYIQRENFGNLVRSMPDHSTKKWSFTTHTGVSTSFNLYSGGSAMMVAAPMGLQLSRRLNNNFYAFAGLSVAPAYVNFNQSFLSSTFNQGKTAYGIMNANGIALYSIAELGLMYVNDARTFSVSGSISVQESSYPVAPRQSKNFGTLAPKRSN